MPPSIQRFSLRERFKLRSAIGPVVANFGNPWQSKEAQKAAINTLRQKVAEKPDEWFCWFLLSDFLSSNGEYIEAIRAAEQYHNLRPREARSAYVLAAAIRLLVRAKHIGQPIANEIEEEIYRQGFEMIDEYNPQKSQEALDEIGWSLDFAAAKAISLLKEAISLGLNDTDYKFVQQILMGMYIEYPHLNHP